MKKYSKNSMANVLQQRSDRNLVKVLLNQCAVDPFQTCGDYTSRKRKPHVFYVLRGGGGYKKRRLARDEVILKSSDRQLRVSSHEWKITINILHMKISGVFINLLLPNVPFCSPRKQKTFGLLIFSGGSKGSIGIE